MTKTMYFNGDENQDNNVLVLEKKSKKKIKKNENKDFFDTIKDVGIGTLKTAGNIATNMGEGALKALEAGMDMSSSIANKINAPLEEKASVLTGISTKEEAKKNRKEQEKGTRNFIATDYTDKFEETTGFKDIKSDWEKNSLVKSDNLGGQISQAVGNMVPSLLIGQATGLGEAATTSTKGLSLGAKALTTGKNIAKTTVSNLGANTALVANSYGGALQEAYQNGATDEEATKYAIGSSATELATEWITGGIPGIKSSGILDNTAKKLIDKSTGKVKSRIVKGVTKTLLNAGYEAVGEGLEEGLSEIISPLLKNATYSKDEKVNWNDVFQSAIVGGITGGILNVPNTMSDFKNNITNSNNNLNKAILPTGINAVNTNNNDNNNLQIVNSINENQVTNTPNSLALPQANINNMVNHNSTIENPLLNNSQVPMPANTLVKNNIPDTNNIKPIQNLSNVNNIEDKYEYIKDNNPKIDNLRRSANEYLNNNDSTKSFVQTAEKLISDKDYNIVFDNNLSSPNGNLVNGKITTLDNGETEIRINPNSDRAGEFLLIHEVTHSIENNEIKKLVMDYATKNKDFKDSLESLKETYGTDDVSSEVLADISGQLFGNEEFINKLSMEKPNIFKKIYNSIISLANKITGNSKESLFVKDLQNKWEKVYRNENSIDLNDKYSLFSKKRNNASELSDDLIDEIQKKTRKNLENNEDVEFVSIDKILSLKKSGGYRSNEEVRNLTNNIIANGIKTPIELVRDKNGIVELHNGNHRLDIANKIGLKEVPITSFGKNSVETIVKDLYNENINTYFEGEENGNYSRTEKLENGWDKSESNTRYSLDNSKQSENESGISRNGGLFTGISGYNDRASSNSTFGKDASKQKKINLFDNKKQNNLYRLDNDERRELEDGSFSLDKKVLKNNLGKEIDITNLSVNNTMKMLQSNRKYDKSSIKAYRGVSESTGSNGAFYGLGLYTTLDKSYAAKYGDVNEVDENLLPNNPLKFKTQNDFQIWEQELARELNIRKRELYSDEYGVEQYIKKLGYDGLMIGTGKDTDLISFTEVAEKYSQNSDKWQQFVEDNFNSSGTKHQLSDMKQKNTISTEDKLINKKTERIQSKYNNEKKKAKRFLTKEASKLLEFSDYKAKKHFEEIISNYYDNPDYDKIKKEIIDNFGEKRIEYIDEELKEIKTEIRKTELKVNDYVKKNLTDYNYFRKSNFNKLKLKNSGMSIDSYYNELADSYPSIFSKELTNEVDQLKRLSEFMDEDGKIAGKYNLDTKAIEDATKFVYDSLKDKDNIDDLINSISISPKEIRREKTIEYREEAEDFVKNSFNWTDKKSGLKYKINTMKRNFYDVMGKNDASKLYSNYINPIFDHNAQMQKDINLYNKTISDLKLNEKESAAVQMLGEYKYNPETLVTGMQVDDFIEKNKLDYDKLSKSVEVFRNTYDNLFERVNEVLKSQGYKELDYRKGYFPHFTVDGPKTKLGSIMEKLGWKFQDNSIPTSIAGITDTFKPGKVWTPFSQQRKGKITDYNALQGFDNYIRGAMQTIYFTDDIQKLRSLENEIRYEHSDSGIQAKIDEIQSDDSLTFDDKQDKIERIYATYITPLNNFVTELRDYTNALANKKSGLDRTTEQLANRDVYNVMTNVSRRLSANMVGLNLSSARTNFIPLTQATSQVKSKYLVKALKETIKNQYSNDGFDAKSVFLTSRLNAAENLYKTKLDKFSDKANFMFNAIDSVTSNIIVRGKYYENLSKGMNEFTAMRNADEFGRDLMAGRTKGEMPTAFNSKNPLIRMFTAFQLETNNQFGYMFKDLPRDLEDEAKSKLLMAFFKMFLGAWIYNKLTGTKAAFSPADTIKEIYDTSTNKNLSITDKSSDILENITQDIPFVGGLVGGGRLPISSVVNPLNIVKGESTLADEAKKAFFYTVLPVGGGQLKKSLEGASMYANGKKTKGSYTSKGALRFEAKKDPLSVTQNVLFGQYSSENASNYFNNGYAPIDKKTVKKLEKMNVSISEYRKYQDDYKSISKIKGDNDASKKTISGTSSGKRAYKIMNSDYSKKEKNYLLSKLSTNDNYPKVSELKKLGDNKNAYKLYYSFSSDNRKKFINELDNYNISLDELCNYYSTRKKYNADYTSSYAKSQMINYIQNSNLDEKTKWYLYGKDYGSDTQELMVNTFNLKTNDYFNTIKYADDINQKYPKEKQSKQRKQMVFSYINNLKISSRQKLVLFSQAGYSTSVGKKGMYQYINNLKISNTDKKKIWNSLY